MTDEVIDRAIKDAREANTEIHIRDSKGKVFQNNFENLTRGEQEEGIEKIDEPSDQELLSNLSSSTEIEPETKEHNLRRSKQLTKTNPIVRLNNPVSSDYGKYVRKTKQPGNDTGHMRKQLMKPNERPCPKENQKDRTTMDTARNVTAKECLGRTTAPKKIATSDWPTLAQLQREE